MLFAVIAAEQNGVDSDPRKAHRKSAGFIIGEARWLL